MARCALAFVFLAGCLPDLPDADDDDPVVVTAETDEADDTGADELVTSAVVTTKKQLTYVVIPHPDDEWEAWSLIEKSSDNYPVFVLLTQGEETSACRTPAEGSATGPSWYQGPSAPTGQPDYNEYVHGNPWQGRWNPACPAARLASFHLFLDRMAQFDSTLPYKPAYRGRFCFSGGTVAPARVDQGAPVTASCARVWANGSGARVIFDLGDTDLRATEVLWAMRAVRANRDVLGIPALREHAVLGAAFYNATAPNSGVPAYGSCDYYGHPDHHAIQSALWNTRLGAGPQYVRACDTDPDVTATGGRVDYVDADTDKAAFAVDPATRQRLGASTVAYGWLHPTYYESCFSGCGFSRKQSFWRR